MSYFLIAAAEETGGDSWKYSLRVSIDWKKIDREKGNASVSFFFFLACVTLVENDTVLKISSFKSGETIYYCKISIFEKKASN